MRTAVPAPRVLRLGLVLSILVALPHLSVSPAATQEGSGPGVAIVVHPKAPVQDLSFAELRRIFMGDQQFWPDRSKITLLVRAPTSYEREVVLNRIYRMTEDRFRQYWIGKMFRAEVASGPKIVYSTDMAQNLAAAIPGAITFMPADAVVPGVKVLRIDGKSPSDAGYPLR